MDLRSRTLALAAAGIFAVASACSSADNATDDGGTGGTDTGARTLDAGKDAHDAASDSDAWEWDSGDEWDARRWDGGRDAEDCDVERQASAPTFSPNPGTYLSAQSITIHTTTPGATIYYTTDRTFPDSSSTVYTGPFPLTGTTRVIAYATGPCMKDSQPAIADYVISCTSLPVGQPQPSVGEGTYNNDFTVTMTSGLWGGGTTCYTRDGSTPGCTVGVCDPGSLTAPSNGISIDGTITNHSTGEVTIRAVACSTLGCGDTSSPTTVTYTLQAADPSFDNPSPSPPDVAYPGAHTSVSTATYGSNVQIYYSTGTTPLRCNSGTSLQRPYPATLPVTEDVTYQAIACKPGYAPSNPVSASYLVQLQPATYSPPSTTPITKALPVTVTVTNPNHAGQLCTTTEGSTPFCNSGACVNGVTSTQVGITSNLETLQTIVCAPSHLEDSDTSTSGPYTLKLDPAKIVPTGSATIPDGGTLGGVRISRNGATSDEHYSFICWSTDGSTPDCSTCQAAATQENASAVVGSGLYVSTGDTTPTMELQADQGAGSITLQAVGCDATGTYASSDVATVTWQ